MGVLSPLRKKKEIVEKSQGKPRTGAEKGRRIIQRKTNGRFHGERSVGRPRLRWEDNKRSDSSLQPNIRAWGETTRDRDIWRRAVEEARARCGCYALENKFCPTVSIQHQELLYRQIPLHFSYR